MDAKLLYREGTAQGASSATLVVRMYEQIVEDLRMALKALETDDVELRTNKINHAILVIGHLESQLNFTAGGTVAEHLQNFYETVRQNLLQAQVRQSRSLLMQQITDLLAVREAWVEVERAQSGKTNAEVRPANVQFAPSEVEHREWNG